MKNILTQSIQILNYVINKELYAVIHGIYK